MWLTSIKNQHRPILQRSLVILLSISSYETFTILEHHEILYMTIQKLHSFLTFLTMSSSMSQWRRIVKTMIWQSDLQYFRLHQRSCWKGHFRHLQKRDNGESNLISQCLIHKFKIRQIGLWISKKMEMYQSKK